MNSPVVYFGSHSLLDLFQLTLDVLTEKASDLSQLILIPWFGRSDVVEFRADVDQLLNAVTKCMDYLKLQQERYQASQSSAEETSTSIGLKEGNFKLDTIEKSMGATAERYQKLDQDVAKLAEYIPLSLTEYLPDDRFSRRRFIEGIKLSADIALYTYVPGGCIASLSFLWKLPMENVQRTEVNTLRVIGEIQKKLPIFKNRASRKDFIDRYSEVERLTPSIMRDMWRTLTGDCSAPANAAEAKVDEQVLRFLACSDDENVIPDLRLSKPERDSRFQVFWDEVDKYFNEVNTAAPERRHGQNVYLPFAISCEDLRRQITDRVPAGTPIPSNEWLRLQFWPKNDTTKRALQHTG